MKVDGIHLCWIVVKDIEAAVKFYVDVVGMHVDVMSPEHGWAELRGKDGCVLGITKENKEQHALAGTNAVVTISVDNVVAARADFIKKGATLVGDIRTIPGHVSLQSFKDKDGNLMQLVQKLD